MTLVLIVLLGLIPRLVNLGSAPPALHPDEAANAADAGAGTWALSYPHERGGQVEGPYVWLAIPVVQGARSLGWPSVEAAARLPAALAGCLLLAASAWAAFELSRLGRARASWSFVVGATLCLALQPWAWHFARLALRASLTPLALTVGLAAWLAAERSARPLPWALLAGASLAAGALIYPPVRMLVPCVAAGLFMSSPPREESPSGRARARASRVALGCALLGAVALVPWTLWGAGAARLESVLAWDSAEPVASLARCARGYLGHYGTRFLFSGSSSRGFSPEGVGLVPHWQIPALVAGILVGLVRRERRDGLLLGGLLLFPLAAALTRDVPNALRAILGVPVLALLAGSGWEVLSHYVQRGRKRGAGRALGCALAVLGLALWAGWEEARLARAYFVVHPRREAAFYYPGRRELIARAVEIAQTGSAVRCELPFLEASLRLYAPQLRAERSAGERWTLGSGEPRVELSVELGPEGEVRVGERALAPRSGSKRP